MRSWFLAVFPSLGFAREGKKARATSGASTRELPAKPFSYSDSGHRGIMALDLSLRGGAIHVHPHPYP
jgi:hypothetical protein